MKRTDLALAFVLSSVFCVLCACEKGPPSRPAQPPPRPTEAPRGAKVFLEDMTSPEVRRAIDAGKTTVIVPTGGTEQNGAHMVLGKHHYVVRYAAGEVARALGNALVAPVMDYVPEGGVEPPMGHMAYAGTLSLPESVFESVLEATARSLRAHGFTKICFLGDSGGNQASQARVAEKLNKEWVGGPTRVLHVGDYYAAGIAKVVESLERDGESAEAIGTHATIRDTSELMFAHGTGVRGPETMGADAAERASVGVSGDPSRASAERGRAFLETRIRFAVTQIQRD